MRWTGVGVLLTLVALLAPPAVGPPGARRDLRHRPVRRDGDALAADPAVQNAVAARVTQAIFARSSRPSRRTPSTRSAIRACRHGRRRASPPS